MTRRQFRITLTLFWVGVLISCLPLPIAYLAGVSLALTTFAIAVCAYSFGEIK